MRQKFYLIAFTMFVLTVLTLTAPASAEPITFQFTGTVTQISDPFDGIDFGTPFSGSFRFDTAAPDGAPGAQEGSYLSSGSPFGLGITVGDPFIIGFSSPEVSIGVCNNCAEGDFYTVLTPLAPDAPVRISLTFQDVEGSIFGSDGLPASAMDISAFELRDLYMFYSISDPEIGQQDFEIGGTIDSLSARTAVPEPGTLLLLSAGFMALGLGTLKTKRF